MSAQALSFVWGIGDVSAEERLALIWIANQISELRYPASYFDWHGMGEFMCCGYERGFAVVSALVERGLLVSEPGSERVMDRLWIAYGGPYEEPVDWTAESKSRSRRVAALIERDGPECAYCDCTPVIYEVDHFVPKAKGGPDVMSNLVLACPPCNRAKRDKLPEEFLKDDLRRAHRPVPRWRC